MNGLVFFSQNVDSFEALDWFERMALAVRKYDELISKEEKTTADELDIQTCLMVINSSAFRLVRDYSEQIQKSLMEHKQRSGE